MQGRPYCRAVGPISTWPGAAERGLCKRSLLWSAVCRPAPCAPCRPRARRGDRQHRFAGDLAKVCHAHASLRRVLVRASCLGSHKPRPPGVLGRSLGQPGPGPTTPRSGCNICLHHVAGWHLGRGHAVACKHRSAPAQRRPDDAGRMALKALSISNVTLVGRAALAIRAGASPGLVAPSAASRPV